jgi:hypothetical protein
MNLEKNMSNALDKFKETLRKKRNDLRKHHRAIRANAEKLNALVSDLQEIGSDPYSDGDWIFIPLHGDKVKFLQFVRVICKHGFEKPSVEKGATGFNKIARMGDGDTELTLYFQFSSTQCRRVKIGTEMVEREIYETVCDELMPYGVPPQAMAEDSIPF